MKKRHILSTFPYLKHGSVLGIILSGFSYAVSAYAAPAPHHTVLPGDDLDLSVPCAQTLIKVDQNLKTGVIIDENSGSAPDIQNIKDGAENQLHIALHGCLSTHHLSLRLSPGTALTLHDSPHATITITGTLSTLDTSLTDASLHLEHIQSLDLSMSGSSVVHIHQLDRAAQIVAKDQSQLIIDQAFLSAFSGQLTGNSQLTIAQGQIDNLNLSVANQAIAHVLVHTGAANVSTNDNAILTLGQVSGPLNRSGSGQIHQMAPPAPAPAPTAPAPIAATNGTDGSAQGLSSPSLPAPPTTPPQPVTPKPTAETHIAVPPHTDKTPPYTAPAQVIPKTPSQPQHG
ncbi:hypothetical protein GS501_09340 [Saccharibacter sp. 17.LH.SD]|uniref:hypothetical protein n=1 Tax=Saccharibacter sp. 17.LH.SD TaxID=2689393 RepID=UPI0013684851|nr:hypothetical protein [Saccharibacter sp. 17.LH.SD]MXV45235.1 hypothetical protein [Saccharibacter sp. 17.LH.SD]